MNFSEENSIDHHGEGEEKEDEQTTDLPYGVNTNTASQKLNDDNDKDDEDDNDDNDRKIGYQENAFDKITDDNIDAVTPTLPKDASKMEHVASTTGNKEIMTTTTIETSPGRCNNDGDNDNDINEGRPEENRLLNPRKKLEQTLAKMDSSRINHHYVRAAIDQQNHHQQQEADEKNSRLKKQHYLADTEGGDDNSSGFDYIRDEDDVALEFQDSTPAKSHYYGHEILPGAYAAGGGELGENTHEEQQRHRATETINIRNDSSEYRNCYDGNESAEYSDSVNNDESSNNAGTTIEVVAFAVNDEDNVRSSFFRREARRDIIRESVHAAAVEPVNEAHVKFRKYAVGCLILVLVLAIVGITVGLTQRQPTDNIYPSEMPSLRPTLGPTFDPRPTIAKVKEEGVLLCHETWIKPLERDLCRAVAVDVLGKQAKIEIINETDIPWSQAFDALKNRTLDLLNLLTRDMYRDLIEGTTSSIPMYYDGLAFGGTPKYVSCADRLDHFSEECVGIRICVVAGSTTEKLLLDYMPDFNIKVVPHTMLYKYFIAGECNVIAETKYGVSKKTMIENNYTEDYAVGRNYFSKDPTVLMTRDDDPEWSELVNWVMNALISAEELNITQSNAREIIATENVTEEKLERMYNIVAEVGNYKELYEKHVEAFVPRDGLNLLNNGSTGLIYSYPFGDTQIVGPEPSTGSALDSIVKRGYLRCGIFSDRPGFATFNKEINTWEGLDTDYCSALSASIFNDEGDSEQFVNRTEFIEFNSSSENAAYVALVNNNVDVVAGAKVSLDTDLHKLTISYTQPYFYGSINYYNQKQDDAFALMTLRKDNNDSKQWSRYVFWIVSSTFYAEEKGITQNRARDMPLVKHFGPKFEMMFQSVIMAKGNYGEMYALNVEELHPRNGTRNELNAIPFGPQHYSLPL